MKKQNRKNGRLKPRNKGGKIDEREERWRTKRRKLEITRLEQKLVSTTVTELRTHLLFTLYPMQSLRPPVDGELPPTRMILRSVLTDVAIFLPWFSFTEIIWWIEMKCFMKEENVETSVEVNGKEIHGYVAGASLSFAFYKSSRQLIWYTSESEGRIHCRWPIRYPVNGNDKWVLRFKPKCKRGIELFWPTKPKKNFYR